MTFEFTTGLPPGFYSASLISGAGSVHLTDSVFLTITTGANSAEMVFEIKIEEYEGPFQEVVMMGDMLAVGGYGYFYLYNLTQKKTMLALKMEGYFGHITTCDELLYVSDAGGLYCINKNGNIHWHNANLAIDGVIITSIDEDTIAGSAEWDPPGGWRDFTIDKKTGTILS